jgi:hypothetical protein
MISDDDDDDDDNSIKFNSILYYLCAESTATRPIIIQIRVNNNHLQQQYKNLLTTETILNFQNNTPFNGYHISETDEFGK